MLALGELVLAIHVSLASTICDCEPVCGGMLATKGGLVVDKFIILISSYKKYKFDICILLRCSCSGHDRLTG